MSTKQIIVIGGSAAGTKDVSKARSIDGSVSVLESGIMVWSFIREK